MMKRVLIFLFAATISLNGFACLNAYNVSLSGEVNDFYSGLPIFYRAFDRAVSDMIVERFQAFGAAQDDYQTRSDVAVHLAHLGRYEESLTSLQLLNQQHPNEYQIVANLGTLYELNGEIDSAFHYISEAMRLNPASHHGSEWVHLDILRAKQKMANDPNWILENKVLNVEAKKINPKYLDQFKSAGLPIQHISHQMVERLPFTPDEDLIVANIFQELAELLAFHLSVEDAYIAYRIAMEYDQQDLLKTKQKMKTVMAVFKKEGFNTLVFETHFPPKGNYDRAINSDPKKGSQQLLDGPKSYAWMGIGGATVGILLLLLALSLRARAAMKLDV